MPANDPDKFSLWYAFGDIPRDASLRDDLLTLVPDPRNNDDGSRQRRLVSDKRLLGNAIQLTEALYDRIPDPIVVRATPTATIRLHFQR